MAKTLKLLALIILFASSCKEDEVPPPFIEVYNPSHLQSYAVGDSISISASISSGSILEYIKISLVNTNLINVNPVMSIYPETENYSLTVKYPISNTAISSGQYYLIIEAVNSSSSEKAYTSINISSIPKRSLSLIAFSYENGNPIHIYKVDSLLQFTEFSELSGDFGGAAVNPVSQYIYCMGKYTGPLRTIDANNGSIIDEIPAVIQTPFPYYNCINWENNLLMVGLYDGYIKGYFNNTNLKFSYLINHFRPQFIKYDGTYLLGSFFYQTNNAPGVGIIYEISGYIKDILFTAYSIVDMYRVSGNNVLLFTMNGSQAELYTLDTYNMIITIKKTLASGEIYSVCDLGNNKYLMTHDNGLIIYDYISNTSSDFYPGTKPGKLCYDEIDEKVYLSFEKEIYSYTWPTAQESGPLNLPDSIKDIHILYNRD